MTIPQHNTKGSLYPGLREEKQDEPRGVPYKFCMPIMKGRAIKGLRRFKFLYVFLDSLPSISYAPRFLACLQCVNTEVIASLR